MFSLAIWPLFPTELPRENFHEAVGPIPEWNPDIQASGEGPEGPSTFSPFTPSLGFTENMGQVGKGGGRYYTEGHPLSVAFGNGWMSYWWRGERVGLGGVLIRVDFEDANDVEPQGIDQIDGCQNYLIGSDPGGWRTGVRTFEKVLYEGLWDNIDLRFFFSGAGLKYELVVHQGGDPADITFSVEGHDEISIISDDTMVISRGTVDITDDGLKAYYDEDHGEAVEVGFQTWDDDLYGFHLGRYDPTKVVVIDPLIYSALIDGERYDSAEVIVADDEGYVFVTGRTYSKNFPITPGVVKKTLDDGNDAFVTKLSPDGRSIVYSTYLGGEGSEVGYALDIDEEGNVFVGGWTVSNDFPTTPGAFHRQRVVGNTDAFVSKLNSNGTSFIYSTLIAGDHLDSVSHINVDDDGYAYLAGSTRSGNFPTTPDAYLVPFRKDRPHSFLSRLSPDGSSLDPSTIVIGTQEYGSA
ncbi:MAG: SBBP repeat-containing protein, partial [Thermoplasmata archaeon]|nr:SBBP repeat-containing protein [Thermoplasmata archaeon]